jgi:hypothetical protein
MIRFSKAAKATKNTKTDANQHNSLAEAFNSRILSGIGDSAWRIFYYAYSTFRGVRNPSFGGQQWPAQDEWFKFYANMEPKSTYGRFGWPQMPAGWAEGANVANPFMAWMFGNDSTVNSLEGEVDETKEGIHGLWSEPIRLNGLTMNFPAVGGDENPLTTNSGHAKLHRIWYDSQLQRGCCAFKPDFKYVNIDGTTATKELQLVSSGISAAARRHLRYVMETVSMGRYAPSYVPDVRGKGGVFRKKNAVKDQIQQAMFHYLSYFRGVEDQRAKHNKINPTVLNDGFNFETFFSNQFLLAPSFSIPKYERDQDGNFALDDQGNKKIKYDKTGYPELVPQTRSFLWNASLKEKIGVTGVYEAGCAKDISVTSLSQNSKGILKDEHNSIHIDTNPLGEGANSDGGKIIKDVNKNRFCLSSVYIQTTDLAVRNVEEAKSLLSGMTVDVYLNDKFYVEIPLGPESVYRINKRNGATNNGKDYLIYQFNKIYHFTYPVKGKVSFRIRHEDGKVNIGREVTEGDRETPSYSLKNFSIYVKTAHVIEMKPTVADAYVLMRVSTTEGQGQQAGQMDPVGHFGADNCKKVFRNYYKFGVGYNLRGGSEIFQNDTYVSANPVYESTRKFITSNIKMADRTTLVDYRVNSEGKSVLYYKRFSRGMKNSNIDIFRGVGPSTTQVGNRAMVGYEIEKFIPLIKGQRYIVLDTSKGKNEFVVYKINKDSAVKYTHGQVFVAGDYYYISKFSSTTVGVFELEGIVNDDLIDTKTPKNIINPDGKNDQISNGNISNQWTMFMTYNLYHWADSSSWKPEIYGDIMGALNNRCLTSSYALRGNVLSSQNVKKHIANVSADLRSLPLITEGPSGYNYIENANTDLSKAGRIDKDTALNFATSCPIYQPPYKVESVKRLNSYDPRCEIIKVTLDRRLPAGQRKGKIVDLRGKLSENLSYYSELSNSFDFRTDETAVIDYLNYLYLNRQCPKGQIGDVALDNNRFWANQSPYGCCHPRFYFVKLIPKVSADTVMYSDHYTQMEYYLRGMCNGFLNSDSELSGSDIDQIIKGGLTGVDTLNGYDSAIGDYLFEDLMSKSYDIAGDDYKPISPSVTAKF